MHSKDINVRATPSATGTLVGAITAGTTVTEIERDGDWLHHSAGWSLIAASGQTLLQPLVSEDAIG